VEYLAGPEIPPATKWIYNPLPGSHDRSTQPTNNKNVIVGICRLEFLLPGCSSLKQKRMVLRSLKQRLRNKHNVAVAEIEYQDLWQRACLGVTSVSNDKSLLDSTFQAVLRQAERNPDAQLLDFTMEFL